MKQFIIAPVAAVVMLGLSGYANAQGDGDGVTSDVKTGMDIYKRVDIQTNITKNGYTGMLGIVAVNQEASALIDNEQKSVGQNAYSAEFSEGQPRAGNYNHNNSSVLGTGSGDNAAGNIGINMSAGDNNVQANNAAMTVLGDSQATVVPTVPETTDPVEPSDPGEGTARVAATFEGDTGSDLLNFFLDEWLYIGASVDAEIASGQTASGNTTINHGVTNKAQVTDSLNDAAGNVGANIASGNSNVQANNFAASYGVGASVAISTVENHQHSMDNNTLNQPISGTEVIELDRSMTFDAGTVDITGTMDQAGPVYPEIWLTDSGNPDDNHPSGTSEYVGHLDFDEDNDSGGMFSFDSNLAADLGSVTVNSTEQVLVTTVAAASLNESLLSGSLNGASGNVGVNVTSGSNNLQSNSLALSVGNF